MAISTRVFNEQALSMLNRITGSIQDVQSRISTGKNVLRASDNPAVSTKISFSKDQKLLIERFNTNIDAATNKLKQAEVTMGSTVNILQRAYELSIQARNGTNNAADLKVIGTEISNLRVQFLSLANTQDVSGKFLFSGFKVDEKPFVEDSDGVVQHNGDAGIHTLQISANHRLATGLDGADVFLRVPHSKGVASIFDTLDELIAQLEAGEVDEEMINKMNSSIEHFTLQQTKIGSQVNRANLQQEVNTSRLNLLKKIFQICRMPDIAKLVTDLQSKLVSRNAAQQSFVKISQDTLFNYLR
jgi:flagellar hook-associated protein 3 FlgL